MDSMNPYSRSIPISQSFIKERNRNKKENKKWFFKKGNSEKEKEFGKEKEIKSPNTGDTVTTTPSKLHIQHFDRRSMKEKEKERKREREREKEKKE